MSKEKENEEKKETEGRWAKIQNKISEFLRGKKSGFWKFMKLNFTDKAYRIDTGRIGQFFGLFFLTVITTYSMAMVISGKEIPMGKALLGSLASLFPMIMYRMKEFSGTIGTAYEYENKVTVDKYKEMTSTIKRNFTDEWGRVDTGRIGQTVGLIVMIVMSFFVVYAYIIHPLTNGGSQLEVNLEQLILLGGEGGTPMLLYRLKQFSRKVLPDDSQ